MRERKLASLWGALENYRHGMVLIGGLVRQVHLFRQYEYHSLEAGDS